MSANYYGPGMGDRFARHASAESIAVHLQQARADRDRYARWVNRLEQLHAVRLAEKASGEWPHEACRNGECPEHGRTPAAPAGAEGGA